MNAPLRIAPAKASAAADAEPVDLHVGARIRLRRKMLGVSQERLAEQLGLTFQQVQKYERGANRVSASKLHAIGAALGAHVSWFFEGLAGPEPGAANEPTPVSIEALDLGRRFDQLPAYQRRAVSDLMTALAAGARGGADPAR